MIDIVKLNPLPCILSFITVGLGLLALGFVYNHWQEHLKNTPYTRHYSPMRAVLQRTSEAQVSVSKEIISSIGTGFLILLGVEEEDTQEDISWLVGKISKMRVFDDPEGKMNLSLHQISGEALVVSQFTLHASTKKGNRPSFIKAAQAAQAKLLYENFCNSLSTEIDKSVGRGEFGAMMEVSLTNDGPVTIVIDSRNRE